MTDDGFWIEPPDEPSGTPDSAATETAALPIQREHEREREHGGERGHAEEPTPAQGGVPGVRAEPTPEPTPEHEPAVEPEPGRAQGNGHDGAELSAEADEPVEGAAEIPGEAPSENPGDDPAGAPAAESGDSPPPPVLDPALLKPQLEAVLMVVENPVPDIVLAQVLEQPTETVVTALRELSEEYTAQNRGFDLRQVAGGWRFYTRPEHAEAVEKFVLDGQQSKLTQAALETLAVVAYRQPVSRSRISAVRGVNCDGVMRTLLARGLVEEYGVEPETGAYLYRTTDFFLERMGLVSLDELPELAPFLPEVEALEAETEGGLDGFPVGGSQARGAERPDAAEDSDDTTDDTPDGTSDADDGPMAAEDVETGDTGVEDSAAADAEDSADSAPADPAPAADDPTDTGSGSASATVPDAADEPGQTTTDI